MRSLIRSVIIADATLEGFGVVDGAVLAGDVDTPAERPFINLRWGPTNVGLSTVDRRLITLWVHDMPGDYARIDAIIRRLKIILLSLEARAHASGYVLMVEWSGDSEDLIDDGHGTITRTTSFTLVSSGN